RLLGVVLLLLANGRACWGQFVRPPIVVPRLPVHVPHIPIHMPHLSQGPNLHGNGPNEDPWQGWIIGGVVALAGIGGGGLLIHSWRKRSAGGAVIRITAVPPGEAPVFVRRAWVGLELPLIPGQNRIEKLTAQQVLSREEVNVQPGYIV